jgi:hypothetical protein
VRLLRDGLHEKTKRVGVTESQGPRGRTCVTGTMSEGGTL